MEEYIDESQMVWETYSYKGAQITLYSTDPEDIKFCSTYVCDYFSMSKVICKYKVYIITNEQLYINVTKNSNQFEMPVHSIAYKVNMNTYEVFYFIDIQKGSLYIVRDKEVKHAGYIGMRAVRSMIIAQLESFGWIFLHAACISKNEKVVALIGNRFAGKTTSIMELLSKYHYDYVSNDMIAIKEKNGSIECISFPVTLGIRHSTISKVKKLQDINLMIPQNLDMEVIKQINDKHKAPMLTQRVNYSCQDILRIMECGLTNNGTLNQIFFLDYLENCNHCVCEVQSDSNKEALIRSQIVSINTSDLSFVSKYYPEKSKMLQYDKLFENIKVYHIKHNNNNINETIEFIRGCI